MDLGTRTKEEKLALLADTIKYYSEDITRRCIGISENDIGLKCYYSGSTINNSNSDGCAIGRLLTPELRQELDDIFSKLSLPSGVNEVWDYLPVDLQSYGKEFLQDLQRLHDGSNNWVSEPNGLSESGKINAEQIKVKILKSEI